MGMSMAQDLTNLEQLLGRIDQAKENRDEVSLGMIVEEIGSRSFGPLLLMAGIVLFSPLSGVPGLPTIMGVLVLLIGLQLLVGKEHFWLPQWLLKRSVAREKISKALAWLRTPASFVDRWLQPRLEMFIGGVSRYAIAIICTMIAAGLPVMELVPFSSSGAGAALTAFGLGLIANDGLLALLAFAFTAITAGLVVYFLL
jgi:hypothetical protein